ncbi:MAG: response regulator, partial [Spirochaetales bacterium]|nr:response regulator [Spirochaetales bacterium]
MAEDRIRLIVIDDDEWIRDYLVQLLSAEGYDVDSCASGGEGIERVNRIDYDLVLMDVKIGKVNGIELIEVVREKE